MVKNVKYGVIMKLGTHYFIVKRNGAKRINRREDREE